MSPVLHPTVEVGHLQAEGEGELQGAGGLQVLPGPGINQGSPKDHPRITQGSSKDHPRITQHPNSRMDSDQLQGGRVWGVLVHLEEGEPRV